MVRKFSSYTAACAFGLICMVSGASCHAQQKYLYNYSSPPDSSRYVHDYSIEVDDVPGHKVRIVEIQRSFVKDPPTILGTKIVETWFRGFTDYRDGAGPGHGYETWTLEDGNKVFLESVFASVSEPTASGYRRGEAYATARFVGGTGKFAFIQGTLTSKTEFDNDPNAGYNRPSTRGEYWLAKP